MDLFLQKYFFNKRWKRTLISVWTLISVLLYTIYGDFAHDLYTMEIKPRIWHVVADGPDKCQYKICDPFTPEKAKDWDGYNLVAEETISGQGLRLHDGWIMKNRASIHPNFDLSFRFTPEYKYCNTAVEYAGIFTVIVGDGSSNKIGVKNPDGYVFPVGHDGSFRTSHDIHQGMPVTLNLASSQKRNENILVLSGTITYHGPDGTEHYETIPSYELPIQRSAIFVSSIGVGLIGSGTDTVKSVFHYINVSQSVRGVY